MTIQAGKQMQQTSSLFFRILLNILSLLFIFCFLGCSFHGGEKNIVWHQYYQPVENEKILSYVWNSYYEAGKAYGPSHIPVDEIHIRQSVARYSNAILARADVVDWQQLTANACAHKIISTESAWLDFQKISCAADSVRRGSYFPLSIRLSILDKLNSLIQSDLFRSDYLLSEHKSQDIALADSFVTKKYFFKKNGLAANRRILEAVFPKIILAMPEDHYVPEGIQLCEMMPQVRGSFVLYIASDPYGLQFIPQLNHEVFHLLNIHLYDWYVEGLSSVFSEYYTEKSGYSWQEMRLFFLEHQQHDPYAMAYFMMKDIYCVAQLYMKTFLKYAVWTDKQQGKMHIDIDAWLASLPQFIRNNVVSIIQKHEKNLHKHKGTKNYFNLLKTINE